MLSLHDFMTASTAAETVDRLYELFLQYLEPLGVAAVSYHVVRERFEALDFNDSLFLCTHASDWVARYEAEGYYADDPIMARAMRSPLPFHWFDVETDTPLTPVQRRFFEDLRAQGFTDGLAVPVFGPSGMTAFFGMGRKEGELDLDVVQVREIQCACHQMHLRVMELRQQSEGAPPLLSAREQEVMQWVARGKSNGVIAEILGVYPHTVDTVMRRAFTKLGASNRISAVLKAASAGLIAA